MLCSDVSFFLFIFRFFCARVLAAALSPFATPTLLCVRARCEGPDGHVARNEPGSSLKSITRPKTMALDTLQQLAVTKKNN